MFGHSPSTFPASEIDKKFKLLKELLEKKYLDVKVSRVSATSNNEIKVMLLNGRHGMNDGIDGENVRPIEYLKTFDAQVSKEPGFYSYCSYSSITFDQSKITDVITGLTAMPTPIPPPNHLGKITLRC